MLALMAPLVILALQVIIKIHQMEIYVQSVELVIIQHLVQLPVLLVQVENIRMQAQVAVQVKNIFNEFKNKFSR